MSEPDVAAWTRQQVEARRAIAAAATCGVSWEAEGDDPTDDEVWIDVDGQEWRLVILRGPQSHENMLHVAANDPQDTIARCEAELAILDLHKPVTSNGGWLEGPEWQECETCGPNNDGSGVYAVPGQGESFWPCETARLLASGYRHQTGYQEAWKPDKQV